jgi:hypothetical protein
MASDEVGVAEPHLAARREAPETVWWRLVEVVLLDVHLAGEPSDSRPEGRVRRVVWRVELLYPARMVVLDCHFDPHSPDKALRFNVACAIQI